MSPSHSQKAHAHAFCCHRGENLTFWTAVREYQKIEDDEDRTTRAKKLYKEYVVDGADQQINVPSGIQRKIKKEIDKIQKEGATASVEMYNAASDEIFTLMERDTFKRFREDKDAVSKLVNDFFKDFAAELQDGRVSFE